MYNNIDNCPTLVLNADYRPLSYFPLSLCSWQNAIKSVFLDRVNVVSEYEDKFIRSVSIKIKVPSIIALKEYIKPKTKPAFTRFNLFLRDKWTCQYCGKNYVTNELTFDHVIPRSKGGGTNWQNIVSACQCCNLKKANYLPKECKMFPIRKPIQPTNFELQANGQLYPPNFLHQSWSDYLYWDTELEDI